MAVRFSAESQAYTRATGLGTQGAFTMMCWARVAVDRNAFTTPFGFDGAVNTNATAFNTDATGTQMRIVYNNATAWNMPNMTVGTWYFLAVAASGTSGTAYWKTPTATSLTTTGANPPGATRSMANLRIGRYVDTGEWLNGNVCAVKLWTSQLTQAEIEIEALQFQPVRFAGLAAYYPLAQPETADYSANGQTLSGGTGTTTEDGPPIPWSRRGRRRLYIASSASNVTGVADAPLAFAAPAAGTPTVLGAVTTALGFAAPASGTPTVIGTPGVAALAFAAPAAGVPDVPGQAATAVAFSGPAAGTVTVLGAAATSVTVAAPAAGTRTVLGAVTTALTFAAPAAGARSVTGTPDVAALAFSAPAAGTPTVLGAVTTALAFAAPAAGVPTVLGSIATTLAFAAPASAGGNVTGTADAPLAFAAAATGQRTATGTVTTALAFTAAASGARTAVGAVVASLAFSAPAAGRPERLGAVLAPLVFLAPAAGTRIVLAAAAGPLAFAAPAAALRAVLGSATLAIEFLAPAAGSAGEITDAPTPTLRTESRASSLVSETGARIVSTGGDQRCDLISATASTSNIVSTTGTAR